MTYTDRVANELQIQPRMMVGGLGRGIVWKAVPFGVWLPNGVTFGKSVFEPNSALVAVLYAILGAPMTRKEILMYVFWFDFDKPLWPRYAWHVDMKGRTRAVVHRGWRASWFAGIKRAGFVTVDRKHRYHLTGLGARVLRNLRLY
jgi:hypothetical protein